MSSEEKTKPATSQYRLKIGLIADSEIASKYLYDLASWCQQQNNLEITHLIIQDAANAHLRDPHATAPTPLTNTLSKLARKCSLATITWLESLILRRDEIYQHHTIRKNLSECIPNSITVTSTPSSHGDAHKYGDRDLKRMKDLNFDLLIHCGSGSLHDETLKSAKLGAVSLTYADTRTNRGGPPGFWEVFHRQDTTGFTITHLSDTPNGSGELFRGRLATKFFYLFNQASLYEKSNFYLKNILSEVANTHKIPQKLDSQPYFNRTHDTPTLRTQLLYATRLASTLTYKVINKFLIGKKYRWGVAFQHGDWKNMEMQQGIRIKNPPNHFLADPFVIEVDGENFCFLEDYDYSLERGYISVYKLNRDGAEKLGDAIVEPFHMSYPCIFKYQSRLYICPETSENRDIRLYECEKFPLDWKLKKTVMADLSAVDTTIFEKDGTWWMFTNIDPANSGDNCYELSLFYADSPLSDTWTPHPENPILVDSSRARMGGILFDGKFAYRVSQQQAFDQYGKCSAINKITLLSKTDYKEEPIARIEPNFFANLTGTHHMHSNGKVTVFDFNERIRKNH